MLRLVKCVRPLFNLAMGVLAAMQGVVWVLILTLMVLYAVGITATRLIGHGMLFGEDVELDEVFVRPWETVADSMFLLFKVMNGVLSDVDADAIDELMGRYPTLKFGFVFFMIMSSWTLLSILTAVVSENMISTTQDQEREFSRVIDEELRSQHRDELQRLFVAIDV